MLSAATLYAVRLVATGCDELRSINENSINFHKNILQTIPQFYRVFEPCLGNEANVTAKSNEPHSLGENLHDICAQVKIDNEKRAINYKLL